MKRTILSTKAIVFALLCLCSSIVFAQRVIDPSVTDPTYNARKLASGKKNNTQKNPKTNNNVIQPIQSPCNVDDGCFIPLDDSYTELSRNDDGSSVAIDLPFTFNLYGSTYNQVWINTNGNLTFTAPFGGYVAEGFPINLPMVAAYWQDVDTRNLASGTIHYKMSSTHLIVTWDNVGYFAQHADLLNTFQIIIGEQGDPIIGSNNNVKFSYKNMDWALPDGQAAFGPATVGINKGNDSDYIQVGRFDKLNCDYDGPIGNNDGVGYLEYKCLAFNVTGRGGDNIPPSASGFPPGDSIVLNIGETVTLTPQFIGPDPGQNVTTQVDAGGLCNVDYTITNGELSTVDMQITGTACNVGRHVITFKATDDGTPAKTTTVKLAVIVNQPIQNTSPYFDYNVTPTNDTTISVNTGEQVMFMIKAKDNDDGDVVTLTATGLPAGSHTNPALPATGNPVSTTFKWTPGQMDVGTYELQFIATDQEGSIDTTNIMIAVTASTCNPPLHSFIFALPQQVAGHRHTIYKGYGPQHVLLTAIPKPLGGIQGIRSDKFMWDNGSKLPVRLVSPDVTTRYDVTITDKNGCESHAAITIYVIDVRCDADKVKVCYNGSEMCVPKDSVSGLLSMGAQLGGCNTMAKTTASIATARRAVPADAAKTMQPTSFTAYPNPARSDIRFKWDMNISGNAKINIMDLQGRVIITQTVTSAGQSINISKLSNGVYMAQLAVDGRPLGTTRFTVSK